MNNKTVKKLGRNLLHGKYCNTAILYTATIMYIVILTAIPFVLSKLFVIESGYATAIKATVFFVITVLAFLFYSSFSLGQVAYFYGTMLKKPASVRRLMFWFKPKYSFKALKLKSALIILKSFWLLIFTLPALMTFIGIITLAYTGGIEVYLFASLSVGGIVLLISGLIFAFVYNQKYFLATHLLTENPRLGVIQAIKQSKNLTEGQIGTIVKFKLSFLPSFLTYPLIIPAFFLHSYYKLSSSIIAKELRM